MIKARYLISLFLLLLFVACDKEQEGNVSPAELIRTISVEGLPDNVLRKKVLIEFQKESSFRIEYWKSDEVSSIRAVDNPEVVSSAEVTLLFLEAQTKYTFRVTATHGNSYTTSAEYEFTTSVLPSRIYEYSLLKDELVEELPGYILLTRNEKPGYIAIVDSRGAVVWYHLFDKPVSVATYDVKTQTISCIIGQHPNLPYTGDEIQVIDLYGKTLLSKDVSNLFVHHDVRRLPDGNVIVVNYVPKTFDLTSRGGGKEETVNGDGLTILNMKGEIVWQWNCFDEMNPVDDPNIMGGMGPIRYLDDWLHANSVNYDEQGNFYMTFNWLNQMWKIDANLNISYSN